MKIIISPSKTQKDVDNNSSLLINTIPDNEKEAVQINEMVKHEIKANKNIWKELEIKANPKLEEKTLLSVLDFLNNKKQAILKYDGLQFKNIAFESMDKKQQENTNKNLLILSGYYGWLKPSDLISNYRLMMNSKLMYKGSLIKDFWFPKITSHLISCNEPILNLASEEYSSGIDRNKVEVIDVFFYIKKNNKLTNLATNSKICRGTMVNLLSEYENFTIEDLKKLKVKNHVFDENLSNSKKLVYVKK